MEQKTVPWWNRGIVALKTNVIELFKLIKIADIEKVK